MSGTFFRRVLFGLVALFPAAPLIVIAVSRSTPSGRWSFRRGIFHALVRCGLHGCGGAAP